ncbi:MAG: D-alanyl-D-alanine carboxypeptidase [Clostridia bacterium]|nr:D-alanyl-D-alanine carboxypeptidase [Clostridia bacterium]
MKRNSRISDKKIKILLKNTIFILIFALLITNFAFFNLSPYKSELVWAEEKSMTSAKAMAVIEKESGRILYSKNQDEKLPMASTTKIITAIYVIENCDDLDKKFEVPSEAVGISGTSIGLVAGEHLSIRELLYGLMLRSGNDSAVALAILTSGSEEKFIEDVNSWLSEKVGVFDTHLANPHGLPDESHYTTASDLAKISAYAMKNPTFCEIVRSQKISISDEMQSKYPRDLVNKNKLLKNYEFADGIKTGYTKAAGRCFVGSATKNNMTLVCVLLNCGPMFEECQELLEKGFNDYKRYQIVRKGEKLGEALVEESDIKTIDLKTECAFYYPLSKSELGKVKVNVDAPKILKAPLKAGEEIGEFNITIENQLIFSDKFYIINNIENNTYGSKLEKIIENM